MPTRLFGRAIFALLMLAATTVAAQETLSPVAVSFTQVPSFPGGVTRNTSATFAFVANQIGATFEASLDDAPFTAAASPITHTNLAQGAHVFAVRARDLAGNAGLPSFHFWTIDSTPPDTQITSGPGSVVSSPSQTVTFTSDDPTAIFDCLVDGSFIPACRSPWTVNLAAEGIHTFTVTARDPAGNKDPSPATITWVMDTGPPDTQIINGPTGTVTTDTATFVFFAIERGLTFECSLDDAAFAPCAAGSVTYTGLAQGPHTFRLRAVDAAGNVDATPAVATFVVDTLPPEAIILSTPSSLTSSDVATFTFFENAAHSHECRLDGGAFAPCSSPASYGGLPSGSHVFTLRVTDSTGNVDPTPASYQWVVDRDAPDTIISSGPDPVSGFSDATFAFDASESGVTYQCRIDGGAFAPCASPISYGGVSDGMHRFEVQALDALGNVDATPGVFTWVVDTLAPETTVVSGPAAFTSATDASVAFTSNDPAARFECRFDDAAFAACVSPISIAGLSDGSYVFQVRAIDSVGNLDSSPATHSWVVDTLVPDTAITGGPSGNNNPTSATFTFSSGDPTAGFECRLDHAAFTPCASGITYWGLDKGDHTVRVRARDAAGNVDPKPAARSWKVR